MTRLVDLTKVVKSVLEDNVLAREDDNILVLEVNRRLGVPVDCSYRELLLKHRIVNPHSIVRLRCRVQQLYPELISITVAQRRRLNRERFKSYAINSRKEDIDE